MSVGRICVVEVDTAQPEEAVEVVAQRMHQHAVGTLVVIDKAREVVGIVTDRDLVARVLAKGLSPSQTALREVMTVAPKTVSPETSIESALLIMRTGRFRRVPVVDDGNHLVGLVTLDDVLMLLGEEFAQIGRLIKRETPRAIIEDQECWSPMRRQADAPVCVGD